MRRALVDRARLAVRWALRRWAERVLRFAFTPTKQEVDAIANGMWTAMLQMLGHVEAMPAARQEPGKDKTLH